MSFTYATLKTAIQDYTENSETTFTNNLSVFIKQAEERILKNVQLSVFRKNATAAFTSSNQYLACPSYFLAPFSLSFTNSSSEKVFLDYKDVNFIQTVNPNSSTTGSPKYYAHYDNDNFIIAPTPNSTYAVEIHYFYRPASLTAGGESGTTWLSTNAPSALLYGSLFEAYTFMKGEKDILDLYNGRFIETLTRLKDLGEARENTDGYRVGLPLKART